MQCRGALTLQNSILNLMTLLKMGPMTCIHRTRGSSQVSWLSNQAVLHSEVSFLLWTLPCVQTCVMYISSLVLRPLGTRLVHIVPLSLFALCTFTTWSRIASGVPLSTWCLADRGREREEKRRRKMGKGRKREMEGYEKEIRRENVNSSSWDTWQLIWVTLLS